MATEKTEKENCKKWKGNGGGAPGAVYGLG